MAINNQHLGIRPDDHYLNVIANSHMRFLEDWKKFPDNDIFTCVLISTEACAYYRNHVEDVRAGDVMIFGDRIAMYWRDTFRPKVRGSVSAWLRAPKEDPFSSRARNALRDRMFLAVLNESNLEIRDLRREIDRNYRDSASHS